MRTAEEAFVDGNCLNGYCIATRLWLVDVVEINGKPVEFVTCRMCLRSYTRADGKMERIS